MFEEYLELLKKAGWNDKSRKELADLVNKIIFCFSRKHDLLETKCLFSRNALLVGEVQSGKTTNFVALTLKALEENVYDIIVVLAGTKTDLMHQTFSRIKNILSQLSDHKNKPKVFDKDILSEQKPWWKEELSKSNNHNSKFIFIVLKQQNSLDLINEILKGTDKNILIIDDESDQATPNIEKRNKLVQEYSRIHEAIVKMQDQITNMNFLFVTATPFSNLLAKSTNDLFPRFAFLTYSPNNYCGLNKFHGVSSSDKDNLIIENIHITPKEEDTIKTTQFNLQIKEAFYDFIIGNVIYRIQNETTEHFQMLINTDSKISIHENVYNQTNKYYQEFKNIIKNQNYVSNNTILLNFVNSTVNKLKLQGVILSSDINKKTLDYLINNFQNDPSLTINLVANNKKFEEEYIDISDQVIIGGEKLQRGVTFKKLRVVFISRVAATFNNADTILQRARWFGYRDKYFNYIRLYMPEQLQEIFENLVNVSSEFRDFVKFNESKIGLESESGTVDLSVIDKIFFIPNINEVNFRHTRPTVNPDLKYSKNLNSITNGRGNILMAYRQLKPSNSINNEMILKNINDLIKLDQNSINNNEVDSLYNISKIGNNKFLLFNSELILSNYSLLIKEIEDTFSREPQHFNIDIHTLLKDYKIKKILFSLMDHNKETNDWKERERTLLLNNSIPITQGYNNNYIGDINIASAINSELEQNILEIQIHKIKPFNKQTKQNELSKYMFCISVASNESTKIYNRNVINKGI